MDVDEDDEDDDDDRRGTDRDDRGDDEDEDEDEPVLRFLCIFSTAASTVIMFSSVHSNASINCSLNRPPITSCH